MANIKIEWLTDTHECEMCGCNYADGALVTIDGKVALDLDPVAHCCDGTDYSEREVFVQILQHLGHTVENSDE